VRTRNRLLDDVAVLYADPGGPYPKLVAPHLVYDERRDARMYAGPHPVVAHPPCGPWGRLKHLCTSAEYDKPLGPLAIDQVRRCGEVVEQPYGSTLFEACDVDFSHVYDVEQCQWGHPARKRTLLYVIGLTPDVVAAAIAPWVRVRREPTHWISGLRSSTHESPKRYAANGCAVPPGIKVCSGQQRRRTPWDFAVWLLDLARHARVGSRDPTP
jgi:hypothetical protein